jgi:hypothetical protein
MLVVFSSLVRKSVVDRDNTSADVMGTEWRRHKSHKRCRFLASFFNRHLAFHQTGTANPHSIFIGCLLSSHERAEPQFIWFVLFPFSLVVCLPLTRPIVTRSLRRRCRSARYGRVWEAELYPHSYSTAKWAQDSDNVARSAEG